MKLDKKDLNGHWFKADKKTYDALVKAGYKPFYTIDITEAIDYGNLVIKDNRVYGTVKNDLRFGEKQAYHHNGSFFTRNDKGEIRGLWVTDVPLEEQAYIDACGIVGIPVEKVDTVGFVDDSDDWLSDDKKGVNDWFFSWEDPKGHKITWQEFIEIFGEDEHRERWSKPEFVAKEKKSLMFEVTEARVGNFNTSFSLNGGGCSVSPEAMIHVIGKSVNRELEEIEGLKFKIEVIEPEEKPKDPHAEIKAKYAEAKEAEKNGGPIVKVEKKNIGGYWDKISDPEWHPRWEYQLRYYEIDWRKVLAWSYVNGEFVKCEFSYHAGFEGHPTKGALRGISSTGRYITDSHTGAYNYCRLPKGTTPKDEWLRETKCT